MGSKFQHTRKNHLEQICRTRWYLSAGSVSVSLTLFQEKQSGSMVPLLLGSINEEIGGVFTPFLLLVVRSAHYLQISAQNGPQSTWLEQELEPQFVLFSGDGEFDEGKPLEHVLLSFPHFFRSSRDYLLGNIPNHFSNMSRITISSSKVSLLLFLVQRMDPNCFLLRNAMIKI